jgi:uroporphyrinogen decarboxylase
MPSEMTSRERVLSAAHRKTPDRVPRTIPVESGVIKTLQNHFNTKELASALKDDHAWVGPLPTHKTHDYSLYFDRPGVTWDEWGRGRIWDNEEHYAEYLCPLEHAETVDEILNYPWPDLDQSYRYEGLDDKVISAKNRGFAVVAGMQETVFEIAWQLRSFDRLFEEIIGQDEKSLIILDHITDRRAAAAEAYARAGVDILSLGDDVAMQDRLLMSPKMWNRWFRPRLERIIQAARQVNPEILVWYHSDGKINDLIPDLISAGVDILNPVQPECVDHPWIKATFGRQLAFAGGLGVQSILPFGTPEQVRQHVFDTIKSLGENGGLIIGPSHVIERDTSIENILAMLSAIDEYGSYA